MSPIVVSQQKVSAESEESIHLIPVAGFRMRVDYRKLIEESMCRFQIRNGHLHSRNRQFLAKREGVILEEVMIFKSPTPFVKLKDLHREFASSEFLNVDVFGLATFAEVELPEVLMGKSILSLDRSFEIAGVCGYPCYLQEPGAKDKKQPTIFRTIGLDFTYCAQTGGFEDPELHFAAMTIVPE